ncbi:MAG TPA: BrnT family toxin [Alphaproteobacteria bacterium]|nr:BrnT family toxin [Alphaproteobacteria bacterium]
MYIHYLNYEWDEKKASANLAKHGVAFDCIHQFEWTTAVIKKDIRRDYGENRFSATGFVGNRLHVAIFTTRGKTLRLIGLRKANSKEQRYYEEETQET